MYHSKPFHLFISILILSFVTSCGIYSFNGASISSDTKTIYIKTFPNYAPIIAPTLSQSFTESLKDKFVSQTGLKLVENEGDLSFEGAITGYAVKPINISGNETAAQKQLTITVKVKFVNKNDQKNNFDKSFARFADFDANVNLADVEDVLIAEISSQLVEDIFNESVVNW